MLRDFLLTLPGVPYIIRTPSGRGKSLDLGFFYVVSSVGNTRESRHVAGAGAAEVDVTPRMQALRCSAPAGRLPLGVVLTG